MKQLEIFDFSKNYVLENERVKLSPLSRNNSDQDFNSLVEIANDSEIWTFFLDKGLGKENFKKYIDAAKEKREKNNAYTFKVFGKAENQIVGLTCLYDYNPELKTIKLGNTWYGTSFQGSRINKNCKFLIFEFLFERLGLERVGFGIHEENLRSINAIKSVGGTLEGMLRNFLISKDGKSRVGLFYFGLIKNDWFVSVKENLRLKLIEPTL